MNWYLAVLKNYAGFSGRARRKEYWMFGLFNMIFAIVAMILDNILGIALKGIWYGPIYGLYGLAILIPSLAVAVRRLHDVGKSGWMILISLIPLIGSIWLFVLLVTDSNPGENQYGPNPKEIHSPQSTQDNSISDTLILITVIFMFVSRLYWAIIPKLVEDWYITLKVPTAFLNLIWGFIPLTLAFAVKNKSMKVVLLIMGGVYLINGFYEVIKQIVV